MKRINYLDSLRILATLAVILTHVASYWWYEVDIPSNEWKAMNLFHSIVGWAVPTFLMISGVLFLNREIIIKEIYFKYISRLLIVTLLGNLIYAIFDYTKGTKIFIYNLIVPHYHMWFLPMIIGVYICIPIYTVIAQKDEILKYFVSSSFIVVIFNFFVQISQDFKTPLSNLISYIDNSWIKNLNYGFYPLLGYGAYFVLGYFLHRMEIEKIYRIIIYFIGAISCLLASLLNYIISVKTNNVVDTYYNRFGLFSYLQAVAIFVYFKYNNKKKNVFTINLNREISKYCLGIYIVHVLVLERIIPLTGLSPLRYNSFIAIPLITLIVFGISFIISLGLSLIPGVRKIWL